MFEALLEAEFGSTSIIPSCKRGRVQIGGNKKSDIGKIGVNFLARNLFPRGRFDFFWPRGRFDKTRHFEIF